MTLLRDYHPVDVTRDGEVLALGARVFVTTDAALVYVADDQRNTVLVHSIDLDPSGAPRADRGTLRGALDLPAADGGRVWLNRSRGCGCGSPLKVMARPVAW